MDDTFSFGNNQTFSIDGVEFGHSSLRTSDLLSSGHVDEFSLLAPQPHDQIASPPICSESKVETCPCCKEEIEVSGTPLSMHVESCFRQQSQSEMEENGEFYQTSAEANIERIRSLADGLDIRLRLTLMESFNRLAQSSSLSQSCPVTPRSPHFSISQELEEKLVLDMAFTPKGLSTRESGGNNEKGKLPQSARHASHSLSLASSKRKRGVEGSESAFSFAFGPEASGLNPFDSHLPKSSASSPLSLSLSLFDQESSPTNLSNRPEKSPRLSPHEELASIFIPDGNKPTHKDLFIRKSHLSHTTPPRMTPVTPPVSVSPRNIRSQPAQPKNLFNVKRENEMTDNEHEEVERELQRQRILKNLLESRSPRLHKSFHSPLP